MEPMAKQIKVPVGICTIIPEPISFKALKALTMPVTIPEQIQRTK